MSKDGYKLKEGETFQTWTKALCAKLNKETEGVKYTFVTWSGLTGCRIDCRPQGKRYQISVTAKSPQHRTLYGDITRVNVQSDDIYPHHPRLNQPYQVTPDGTVNIAGIHKCVLARIALIEDYKATRKSDRERRQGHVDRLAKALEGSGVKVKHNSDHSGFMLLYEDTSFNCTFSGDDQVEIRLWKLFVRDGKIPAVLEALQEVVRIKDAE